jgi:ferredoxin
MFMGVVLGCIVRADARFIERRRPVRVEVDRDACEANAICAGLVPEVFDVDDEDVLHIKLDVIPANLADSVRHAVRSCPKAALSLEE